MKTLLSILLCLSVSCTCVAEPVSLTWTAPTSNEDGTMLSHASISNHYERTKGAHGL